jgi:hypothetical protein
MVYSFVSFAFTFTLFSVPTPTQAGDAKGNGGGALLCPGKNLEILDYHEAKALGFGEPQLGSKDDVAEMVNEYLSRLRVHSPIRAQIFRGWFESFASEAVFLNSIPIGEIDDLGISLPPGCEWRQIINQNPLLLPAGKKYIIDHHLWDQLSSIQKVGLIFHELLYRESDSKTSQGLRRLNGLIVTDRLNGLNLANRINLAKEAGLDWVETQGLMFTVKKEYETDSTGNKLLRAYAVNGSTFFWKEQPLQLRSDVVTFSRNGNLKSLRILNHLSISVPPNTFDFDTIRLETPEYTHSLLEFHENGEFKEGPLDFSRLWNFLNTNLSLNFRVVRFNEAGQLESLSQTSGHINLRIEGVPGPMISKTPIENLSEVSFYPNGGLKSFLWGSRHSFSIWAQEVFPRYGTKITFSPRASPFAIQNLGEHGSVQSFITDRDGRLKVVNKAWIEFKAGDLVQINP